MSIKNQFFFLWVLCLLGSIAVFPYLQEITHIAAQPKLLILGMLQAIVLYGFLVFFGLKLARSIQFQIFYPKFNFKLAGIHVVIGIALALLAYVMDAYVFKLNLQMPQLTLWKKILGSLYGGINEEVLLRLFLLSLLIKIFTFIFKTTSQNNTLIVIAIILVALAFGVLHLPAMSHITDLTPWVITRTIILNAIAGIVFGWLYWQRSLGSAMLAHGTTDVVIALIT